MEKISAVLRVVVLALAAITIVPILLHVWRPIVDSERMSNFETRRPPLVEVGNVDLLLVASGVAEEMKKMNTMLEQIAQINTTLTLTNLALDRHASRINGALTTLEIEVGSVTKAIGMIPDVGWELTDMTRVIRSLQRL
jgi:hypothetical protein